MVREHEPESHIAGGGAMGRAFARVWDIRAEGARRSVHGYGNGRFQYDHCGTHPSANEYEHGRPGRFCFARGGRLILVAP